MRKVEYNVGKSFVDRLAQKPRDFSLFDTSNEFLIDQKDFHLTFHRFCSQYLIT